MDSFITEFLGVYTNKAFLPSLVWSWVVLLLILLLFILYKKFGNSSFVVFFELIFEKIYEFFEDILWIEEKKWIKVYVTSMFFIILISNLLWVLLEFTLPVFGHDVEHYIKIPTADINFNIAMAIVWVMIVLYEQFNFLWVPKALYEYFPFLWKNYIPYERWNLPKIVDIPLFIFIKIFDIIISIFLWLLEIVWHAAKVISLAFRLFWNVTSGSLLLGMLISWIAAMTTIISPEFNFPIIWPVIIYLQELLVSLIQALVFPLLIAIFIKVAKVH